MFNLDKYPHNIHTRDPDLFNFSIRWRRKYWGIIVCRGSNPRDPWCVMIKATKDMNYGGATVYSDSAALGGLADCVDFINRELKTSFTV